MSEDNKDELGIVRPSKWWLRNLLSGNIAMEDAPHPIQSWARYHIHEGALEVLRSGGIEERRATLLKIPARIRPYVEAEAKRVWPMLHGR